MLTNLPAKTRFACPWMSCAMEPGTVTMEKMNRTAKVSTSWVTFLVSGKAQQKTTRNLTPGNPPTDCVEDEFECNDGSCIELDRKCDGHNDCDGGEDEDSCAPSKKWDLIL